MPMKRKRKRERKHNEVKEHLEEDIREQRKGIKRDMKLLKKLGR